MFELIERKRGRIREYYLLVKEGDSILYNGWYQMEILGPHAIVGDSLANMPECQVSAWTLRSRINNRHRYDYASLWDLITEPPRKNAGSGVAFERKKQLKTCRSATDRILPYLSKEYRDTMKLFKPGSLAHMVR